MIADLIDMLTRYFTFGQGHRHEIGGVVFDKNIVVRITAPNPRAVMFGLFGRKWAFEYEGIPHMEYFPNGILNIETLLSSQQIEAAANTEIKN